MGYTNAGKSTLFNRLTEAEVEARDMLFATLDPTLRTVKSAGRPTAPSCPTPWASSPTCRTPSLVDAFRATLEEVQQADVILHVRDLSSPETEAEAADVAKVLSQLKIDGEAEQTLVEVWNK